MGSTVYDPGLWAGLFASTPIKTQSCVAHLPPYNAADDGVRGCGRLPEDVEQLERLNSAMSNLATDNDRDVAGKARALNDQFKRTPVSNLSAVSPCSSLGPRCYLLEFQALPQDSETPQLLTMMGDRMGLITFCICRVVICGQG